MLTSRLSPRLLPRTCVSILTLFLSSRTFADERDAGSDSDGVHLTAPFLADVKTSLARVYLRPDVDSPEVGLLRRGATVTVTACSPNCAALNGWGVLGTDGVVEFNRLSPVREQVEASALPAAANLWYGRVGKLGIKIFREPQLSANVLTRKRLSRELAFYPNVDLRKTGWFERVEGGFVRAARVEALRPSLFQGEVRPVLPLAFVIRELRARAGAGVDGFHRYDRMTVHGFDARHIATDRGELPRGAVRIISQHDIPPSIPIDAKWVLVDLSQQTLTAYDGGTAVYATLISSGKDEKNSETSVGLFQVKRKMAYSDMHGESDDPYDVDRVPDALYYHKNEALHGTYWHDRFGSPASHGCVNLSLADAQWLFDWSPPTLPRHWSAINPRAADLVSLWVLVERRANASFAPLATERSGYSDSNDARSRLPTAVR